MCCAEPSATWLDGDCRWRSLSLMAARIFWSWPRWPHMLTCKSWMSAWAEGNDRKWPYFIGRQEMTGAFLLSLNVKGKLRRILDRIYNDLQRFYCTTWKTSWRKRCWCRKRSSCLCAHCFIVSLNDIIARCLTPSTNEKRLWFWSFRHCVSIDVSGRPFSIMLLSPLVVKTWYVTSRPLCSWKKTRCFLKKKQQDELEECSLNEPGHLTYVYT